MAIRPMSVVIWCDATASLSGRGGSASSRSTRASLTRTLLRGCVRRRRRPTSAAQLVSGWSRATVCSARWRPWPIRRVWRRPRRGGLAAWIFPAVDSGRWAWARSEPRITSTYEDIGAVRAKWAEVGPADSKPSNVSQLHPFRSEMKKGDIIIVPYGNTAFRAIGEVTGDYTFVANPDGEYNHRREVNWLLKLEKPLPLDSIVEGAFTMRTLYPINASRIRMEAVSRLIGAPGDAEATAPGVAPSFVLVIDEINRANISKVFGELITLLEADKRLGMENEIRVKLPYSGEMFGVPANLHLIGTMNTADRSIALLDTALRRRFTFEEIMPDPDLLRAAARRTGVDLVAVLKAVNERIEYLFDREHQVGHAFFMACQDRHDVDAVMRDRVIPLLQEYFFEDWSRLAMVLGEREGAKEGAFLNCDRIPPPPSRQ
ncbi:MAG: hypothetical protein B7Z44_16820 [Caulobacter sp. 12-67-6]|nr:MAG: hypothetical protein B7Z44_16820 [Caulobacter sp. 12-67-6]